MTFPMASSQIMPERQHKKDAGTISGMFNAIAPTYDRLNHLLSFGIDRTWRRKLVRTVISSGAEHVLDVACGTGDVAVELRRRGVDVIGVDISREMLSIAARKAPDITFMYGDASALPFQDGSFDAVTIAFGIRNFDMRPQCIREIFRVLRDGGMLSVVEFSIPRAGMWRRIYTWYFRHVLPAVGRLISGQSYAYTYLPESSFNFPAPELFCKELSDGGFRDVTSRSMTGGVAYLYTGRK